jgi:hypothetical protein
MTKSGEVEIAKLVFKNTVEAQSNKKKQCQVK